MLDSASFLLSRYCTSLGTLQFQVSMDQNNSVKNRYSFGESVHAERHNCYTEKKKRENEKG
jgi:hypothetical protein